MLANTVGALVSMAIAAAHLAVRGNRCQLAESAVARTFGQYSLMKSTKLDLTGQFSQAFSVLSAFGAAPFFKPDIAPLSHYFFLTGGTTLPVAVGGNHRRAVQAIAHLVSIRMSSVIVLHAVATPGYASMHHY
jgi:hypothetical protein